MKFDLKNPLIWIVLAAIGGFVLWKRKPIAAGAASAATTVSTEVKREVQKVTQALVDLKKAITSEVGILLLKQREGWRDRAYKDVAGLWTIGYGHLIKKDEMTRYVGKPVMIQGKERGGVVITKDQGDTILRRDLSQAEQAVRNLVKVPISQEQFDALVNFTFNVGVGAFERSTMLKKLNAKDYRGASAEFPEWAKITKTDPKTGRKYKEVVPGLANRRAEEQAMFDKGIV